MTYRSTQRGRNRRPLPTPHRPNTPPPARRARRQTRIPTRPGVGGAGIVPGGAAAAPPELAMHRPRFPHPLSPGPAVEQGIETIHESGEER